jgi:peptidylprolyl isomerase/peptidyl-prolyl cis-trans isomerase B (cyclophilin B)
MKYKISFLLLFLSTFLSCQSAETKNTQVLISTEFGDITVLLYDDTPQHRDNFLKLVDEGFYNDLLFHRVIDKFMIQGGDPTSKDAPQNRSLGTGNPGYTIPAEIVYPAHFHKKGALAAARTDSRVNPEKASSGSQFYIVTGEVFTGEQLKQMEDQKNFERKRQIFSQIAAEKQDSIQLIAKDKTLLDKLQNSIIKQAEQQLAAEGEFAFTPEQQQAYSTVGGAPFLDNEYTVFGEVVDGFDVLEKIGKAQVGAADRPLKDIKMTVKRIN